MFAEINRSMKSLLLLLIPFFALAQVKQPGDSLKNVIVNNYSIHSGDLKIYYRKSSIPSKIKKELRHKFHDFTIANPGKNYNMGCVKKLFIPNKQLQFIVNNGNYYGVVFKVGGRALSTYFAFAEIESGKLKSFALYDIYGESVEDYLSRLQQGKFTEIHW